MPSSVSLYSKYCGVNPGSRQITVAVSEALRYQSAFIERHRTKRTGGFAFRRLDEAHSRLAWLSRRDRAKTRAQQVAGMVAESVVWTSPNQPIQLDRFFFGIFPSKMEILNQGGVYRSSMSQISIGHFVKCSSGLTVRSPSAKFLDGLA